MKEPTVKKYPTEIFCHPYTNHSDEAKKALNEQYCLYIKGTCKKPRKSEPHIKVGVCSVGYKGFLGTHQPIIICPHRFNGKALFDAIKQAYLTGWKEPTEWVSEVNIGVGGNVDFVAVQRDTEGKVKDFLCVEFQAGGTTGTPWQAVLDFKENRKFKKDNYPYGINWANEFMKTMMQQVYKKGKIIDHWERKIVFVIQDVALTYLRKTVDTSDLRSANNNDPIHFCTFRLDWNEMTSKWDLVFNEKVSTDLEGVNRILGGAGKERYLTQDQFKANIFKKGIIDGVFRQS